MYTLSRISNTFDNVRNIIKTKSPTEKITSLKKEFQKLNSELTVFGQEHPDNYVRSLAMEAYLALLSAKIIPMSLSEKTTLLKTALDKLKPHSTKPECLFIYLRVQNLLCYFLIHLDQITLTQSILESTEELYDSVYDGQTDRYLDAEDLFTAEPLHKIKRVNPDKIDKVITNNVQMQAFIYNKLNLKDKYVLYQHTALRRQLEMKDGTPQEWALKTARLGNYFTHLNQLKNARNHLCVAYHVLKSCHDNCRLVTSEFQVQKADFEIYFLELSHHWVKYGLTLFKTSKKRVLARYFTQQSNSKADLWKTMDVFDPPLEKFEEENAKDVGGEKEGKGDIAEKIFLFPTLAIKDVENKVPLEPVCGVEEARNLFAFTYKWLMRAKHYYNFENQPSQYMTCSLQLAELYEHLAFFERNIDNQYSLQKRRADVLEALNSLLKSCDSVMSMQIDVIRELSQVQLELMALNLQKLWHEESHANLFNVDGDMDSLMNLLDSNDKTLIDKTPNITSSRNLFLRKMEAASSLNGKLFRLSGQLSVKSKSPLSSQLSFVSGPIHI